MSERIAILGGGLTGHGVAQVFAVAGHAVRITDPIGNVRDRMVERIGAHLDDLGIDRAALAHVAVAGTLEDCVEGADHVIEAAPENLELKQQIFVDMERAARADAILASNTSVIPISRIAERVRDKSRVLGTHWWNPPYLAPLIEVIRTAKTSDAAIALTMNLLRRVGKAPVEVKKDVAGFVGNRLQRQGGAGGFALYRSRPACDVERRAGRQSKANSGRTRPFHRHARRGARDTGS
jgi:3-hydroxybutyryl-CoA dehydrogenase